MSKTGQVIRQLINGVSDAPLSLLDRGLHYGDGLFETMLVKNSTILHLSEHFQRLHEGCRRLNISVPSYALFSLECTQLLGEVTDAVIKVIVTRGESDRGYRYPAGQKANRVLILYSPVRYPQQNWLQGIKLRVCKTYLGSNRLLAGLKHLNRLEQVLARSEWDDAGIVEGVMLDSSENVIEGTMSNIFMVEKGKLFTADLSECGVEGIMRKTIIEEAQRLQMPVRIEIIPLQRLFSADEVFICNSIIGIWPVNTIAEQHFQLGPITSKLMNSLKVLRSE